MNVKIGRFPYAFDKWSRDWGGLRGHPAPRPNDLIRSLCAYIGSHRMGPAGVFGYYGANGLDCQVRYESRDSTRRPAKVNVSPTGMSMVSSAGYETVPTLDAAMKLWARYARFCMYMRETRHNWQFIGRSHYADNSIEAEYRSSLTGEIRRVMELAPGGDACF